MKKIQWPNKNPRYLGWVEDVVYVSDDCLFHEFLMNCECVISLEEAKIVKFRYDTHIAFLTEALDCYFGVEDE